MGLIWDIQEELLGEADFLLETRSQAIDSLRFTPTTLRAGPEERLLAHLAALHVGGDEVVDKLLLPVLVHELDDDEFRTAATALTLIEGASVEVCGRVLEALDRAEDKGRRGILRALKLARREGLVTWLARDVDTLEGPALAERLEALASHRTNAGSRLIGWLGSSDRVVRLAAATLARHCSDVEALRHLYPLMRDDDDALRWAAIESGLIRGLPGAWQVMGQEAFARPRVPHRRHALIHVAMLGDAAVTKRLLTELHERPSIELLAAATYTRRAEAVDGVVAFLEHEELARLAGETLCVIAGASLGDDEYWLDSGARVGVSEIEALPALTNDDLDAELVLTGDDSLALPNPQALRAWWAQRRDGMRADTRYSRGKLLDPAHVNHELETLPNRWRHALARELAVRSRGVAQLQTDAFIDVQQAQLETSRPAISTLDFQTGLSLEG